MREITLFLLIGLTINAFAQKKTVSNSDPKGKSYETTKLDVNNAAASFVPNGVFYVGENNLPGYEIPQAQGVLLS